MRAMDRLPIVVNLLKGEDAPRWDDFVRRCPQATFFHLSAWRELMEQVFDHRTFYPVSYTHLTLPTNREV